MVMKKLNLSIVFLFLMILFLGFASAQSCSIVANDSCNDYVVMGLSGLTNAHGELWNQGNYDYVLCCDFGAGDRECSSHLHPEYKENASANKIIGLSSLTNAHAEIPGESNYETEVCYSKLACISNADSCSGTGYSMEILSLSNNTNGHIGGFDDYDTKICCEEIECRADVLFCRDYDEKECNYNPCDVADKSVNENNPDITCGEEYICVCEWNESGGTCGPRWEATKIDYCGNNEIGPYETCDGTNMPFTTCSGNVDACAGGTVSCYAPGHENECTLDISGCTGCVEEGFCGDNTINNVYETCDNESLNDKTCADFGLCEDGGLSCYPPEHVNNCTFNTTGCVSCEDYPSKIGKCSYEESTDDDCDDKFLTYSWEGIWTWDSENIFDTNPDGDYYILGDDGKWHYDPNRASEKCVDGSNTVPCPAQIQLPFFGSYSIVVIIVLIALIYIFLTQKKKGKKLKFFKLFSKK